MVKLALVVLSAPVAFLAGVVVEAVGGNPLLVWIPWLAGAVVALVPLRRPDAEADSVEAFRRDLSAREPVRPRGDKGLRPVSRLSGTDPLDSIWGTQSRFPAAPDDLGDENPHHLRVDEDPERDEPPR